MKNTIPQSTLWIYLCMFLLPFNGGFINAATLVSYLHNSVGYVTGNITFAGAFLEKQEYALFFNMLLLILCFIAGAFISGLIIKTESYHKDYRYDFILITQICLVFVAMLLMLQGYTYSEYLLALTMGLQNAMTTHYSGALIRTTHMTGTATDLGILLAHMLKGKLTKPWLIKLYAVLIFSFLCGAIIGAFSFSLFKAYALTLPICIYLFMVIIRKV